MSNLPEPVAWGWRKYQMGAPIWEAPATPPEDSRLLFWRTIDNKQFPQSPRWHGLGDAFVGFVGGGDSLACAYSLEGVIEVLKQGDLVLRSWHPELDAVAALDFIEQCLLSVWMGQSTPFILTTTSNFLTVDGQKGGILANF